MRPVLRILDGLERLIDGSGALIVMGTLTFMFAALLLNVVLRYAFGEGIAWAYEIHAILLPWLVAGGCVVASARGRNIAVTALANLAGPAGRRVIAILVNLLIAVIAVGVLWSSQPIIRASQFQRLSETKISQIWGYASLIYAFALMAVLAAIAVIRLIVDAETKGTDHSQSGAS